MVLCVLGNEAYHRSLIESTCFSVSDTRTKLLVAPLLEAFDYLALLADADQFM